jgi:hypothetical protein
MSLVDALGDEPRPNGEFGVEHWKRGMNEEGAFEGCSVRGGPIAGCLVR